MDPVITRRELDERQLTVWVVPNKGDKPRRIAEPVEVDLESCSVKIKIVSPPEGLVIESGPHSPLELHEVQVEYPVEIRSFDTIYLVSPTGAIVEQATYKY